MLHQKYSFLSFFLIFCSIIITSIGQSSLNINPLYQVPFQQQYQPPSVSSNIYSTQYGNQLPQQSTYSRFGGGPEGILQLKEFEKYRDVRTEEGWFHLYPYGNLQHDGNLGIKPFHDYQIDFDFDFPYYGFRFNYTIIYPNGLIAFSVPEFIQPPWTFPNPKWPEQRDASFIAPFYAEQEFQFIGEVPISMVYYRTIHRPKPDMYDPQGNPLWPGQTQGSQSYAQMSNQNVRNQRYAWGRVFDPWILDNITNDIQNGIIGASGFRADYALIVTWERMGYGGAPKITDLNRFEEARHWFNTYQMVLATDEIRSYVMFNYGHINWTSANAAGALRGRGGYQSATIGFNAGNGTGFTPLPYSGEGRSYKLTEYSNVMIPGRWLYRVDEQIIPGGCSNASIGWMYTAPIVATMLGGITVNVSGPCMRPGDVVRVIFDEYAVDCIKLNQIRASCVLPVDKIFKIGMVTTKMSRDGGMSYPFVGTFYIVQPALAAPSVTLLDDPQNRDNAWHSWNATSLVMEWSPVNLTGDFNSRIDISLWGYWEDTDDHVFQQVGVIARQQPNNGRYILQPSSLVMDEMLHDAWRRHNFGVVRVSVSGNNNLGVFWSKLTSFGWYFRSKWEYEYGTSWATDKCIEWFNYDGQRVNFFMDLEPKLPCPCTMDQALLDFGRYTAVFGCDREGDASCEFYKGSQHCVMSVASSWTGAGQICCYDFEGWLQHADDYENAAYVRFYSPGVSQRGHPLGSYPFKRPPYVPSMSNYFTDLMAYEMCCKWSGHCEFYYWRRPTSGCIEYRPPAAGYVFGEPHFVTFDGTRYSFQGKGYYVLTMMKSPTQNLMIQIRMEQPPKTAWKVNVNATVVTGVAVQENDSDIVQILVRKEFRNWRYRMDVLVNGVERYFDTPELKLQKFRGITLRSLERNHNQSEIYVMCESGAGLRVAEAYGMLDVTVVLPPQFNESYANQHHPAYMQNYAATSSLAARYQTGQTFYSHQGANKYVSMGLLGTFNSFPNDDLMTPEGAIVTASYPPADMDLRRVYDEFGERWKVDNARYKTLFQDTVNPIYDPILFADLFYTPVFDPSYIAWNTTSLLFSREEVRATCQGVYECQYDYIMTGMREVGLNTMNVMNKLEGLKYRGSKIWISCGALLKSAGAIKYPPGNNYLDGVTVTFTCKPEYFLHGDQQRTCVNGTWTPGWWVWCRSRTEEYALKWFTGIIVPILFILLFVALFYTLYLRRKQLNDKGDYRPYRSASSQRPSQPVTVPKKPNTKYSSSSRDPFSNMPTISETVTQIESEPRPVHLAENPYRRRMYSETSA